jgi:hypothetical protein
MEKQGVGACSLASWKFGWFLTFSGRESNCQFYSWPFFWHNLCFRCPNGSCKPISDIYVPRSFQWYNERLNPMSFDACNHSLKIQESIGTPTPKVRVPLGVWGFIPSHSFALSGAWNVTPGLPSWPALLQALALVASPRLGLRHIMLRQQSHRRLLTSLPAMVGWMWGETARPPNVTRPLQLLHPFDNATWVIPLSPFPKLEVWMCPFENVPWVNPSLAPPPKTKNWNTMFGLN